MKLEKLLERMDYKVLAGSTDIEISTLVYDSRKVEKASVFVCISGLCQMHMISSLMW